MTLLDDIVIGLALLVLVIGSSAIVDLIANAFLRRRNRRIAQAMAKWRDAR